MSGPPVGRAPAWELAAPYAASAFGALVAAGAILFAAGLDEIFATPVAALLAGGLVLFSLWGHRRVFHGRGHGAAPVVIRGLVWGGLAGLIFLVAAVLVAAAPALLLVAVLAYGVFRVPGRWGKAGFGVAAVGLSAFALVGADLSFTVFVLLYGVPVAFMVGAVVGGVAAAAGWLCLRLLGAGRTPQLHL